MMLVEEATVPEAVLPLAAFKAHLRLGTGFTEDDLQDAVLVSFLRAAISAIEARVSKALIERSFRWTVNRWRGPDHEPLPIAPVGSVSQVSLQDQSGASTAADPESYCLKVDSTRPVLGATGSHLPSIPSGGNASVIFTAGFGSTWDSVPNDLAQAAFLLAAHYYEYRDETSLASGCMPFGVQSLLERYRPIRLFSGTAT